MKKFFAFLTFFLLSGISLFAQVSINADGSPPDNSAMLDIKSTTKGFLAPRMTQAGKNALTAPATGLTIYQTDGIPGLYYNSGTPGVPVWLLVGNNAGQWLNNGTGIHYITGNVGIGTSTPLASFHVEKNSEYTALFGSDIRGYYGVTNVSIGDNAGTALLYVGQSRFDKGFLIWNYNATPANAQFWVGTYDGLNPLILQPVGGNVGIGNIVPAGNFHVAETPPSYTGIFGTPVSAWNTSTNVSIGDDNGDAVLYIGQSPVYKGFLYWKNNVITPSSAYFALGSFAGTNPLILQESGGNVGVGTLAPESRLQVKYDDNGQNYLGYSSSFTSYLYHAEDPLNGAGQSGLYAYRTRTSQNDGTGYSYNTSNSASMGYSFWGDIYSFGASGFNYNDFLRCGGILGAEQGGNYWGSLGYRSSASTGYGGYFTSSLSGGGKSSQANTGIGIGAWGDLMGADIHGKVYGVYAEGGNYAQYSNGVVFKNNLDVHLQDNGTNTNTVLYTCVSTDATIQTSGFATLSDGKTSVDFDAAFISAVSSETPVVITVTPTGNSNGVYLSEFSRNGFKVVENNDGKSSVTISYIAIGKRAGYEHPDLPREVIESNYTRKMAEGLHNDADTKTNGEGLYYDGGKLLVGKHPSTLPDQNKPAEETVIPKPATPQDKRQAGSRNTDVNGAEQATGARSPSGKGERTGTPDRKPVTCKRAIEDFSKPSPAKGQQDTKSKPLQK